ncbi:MAG: RdgB/HAM1 family non-canonical purine NTP pyrophosphatase [Agromyces sp.]
MQLVLATQNQHKVAEFQALFDAAALNVSVVSFDGEAPAETGVSFAENALIKARAAAQQTGHVAIADDSGIMVDVLGGAPGIFSARWAGAHASDQANRDLLLSQLSDIAAEHRGAAFHCEIALVVPAAQDPEGAGGELTVSGTWPGMLAVEESGEHGFGYDPVFIPAGFAISAAELRPEVKNEHSHRARAFLELVEALRDVFPAELDS